MTLLIAGLALFLAIHLLPSAPALRASLAGKLGDIPYKIGFSLVSAAGLTLIVLGLMDAPFEALYQPPAWGQHAAIGLMLPALYLFFSGKTHGAPSSATVFTAHPMSWGVILWSVGHLLANGDLAHVLLFGSFAGFSAISIITGNQRGARPAETRPPLAREAVFVVIVVVVYAMLVRWHIYLTGMPLVSS